MAAWAADRSQSWEVLTFAQFGLHATLHVKTRQALYYKAGKDRLLTIVLVRDPERVRKLGSLIRTGRYTSGAAAAVIVAYEKEFGQYGMSDASRAIQSMILVAWGDGVGSNWTGFGGMEEVRRKFGIPDAYDVLAVLPFGYPKRKVIGKKKRKPFKDVVSSERFGQAL